VVWSSLGGRGGGDVIREGQGHLLPTCSWTVGSGRCTRCLHFFVGVVFIFDLHLSVSLSLSFISQLEAWWETSALELWWSTFLVPSLCAGITLSHSPWTSSGDITVVVSLTVWGAGLNTVGSLFIRLWVRCWISSCYV
jgi:hypothetical protein